MAPPGYYQVSTYLDRSQFAALQARLSGQKVAGFLRDLILKELGLFVERVAVVPPPAPDPAPLARVGGGEPHGRVVQQKASRITAGSTPDAPFFPARSRSREEDKALARRTLEQALINTGAKKVVPPAGAANKPPRIPGAAR